MNSKLNLSLNKEIIEKAKQYAKSKNTNLSKLIETYLASLLKETETNIEITPLVESLSGVIKLPENHNNKDEYTDFLLNKYK